MSSFVSFSEFEDGVVGDVHNPNSIYQALCVCGHALYIHGFVRAFDGFWVSQCTRCPVDNNEFSCSSFVLDIKSEI